MDISINLMTKDDAKEIFEFEIKNKDFFESVLPPKSSKYYDINQIKELLKDIEDDQYKDIYYMYLIRDKAGEVVGTVDLFSIVRGYSQKLEIGYRIGKEHNGKGYATKAIDLACSEAFTEHNIHRVEACVATKNLGSQIALLKNGFEFVGKTRQVKFINGRWQDGIIFEKIKDS